MDHFRDGTASAEIGLSTYVRILWRRRWLVVAAVAVASAAALSFSTQQTRQYEAVAKIFIGPRTVQQTDLSAAIEELNFSREFVASYAELLKSRPLAEEVIEREAIAILPTDLVGRIDTRIIPDTRIIEVSLTDGSSERAQLMVNSLADTFTSSIQKDFGGRAGVQATVLEPALRPEAPVSPKPVRDGVLGGILGLMVGVGAAFLLEQMDTRIRTRADAEGVLDPHPLLAIVPVTEGGTPERIAVEEDPKGAAAEAFRILRTAVQFVSVDRPVHTVLVTSPYAQDGKSTVAANLAVATAQAGRKTLLIESDLRRPRVHDFLGVPQTPGITDVLVGRARLGAVIRPTRVRGLAVLPVGPLPPNPAELLGSRKMADLIAQTRALADVVILDSPPALPVADPTVLAPLVDGLILVLRAGVTHRERAREALATFERLGVRVLGGVLNAAPTSSGYYRYYYDRSYVATGNGAPELGEAEAWRAAHERPGEEPAGDEAAALRIEEPS